MKSEKLLKKFISVIVIGSTLIVPFSSYMTLTMADDVGDDYVENTEINSINDSTMYGLGDVIFSQDEFELDTDDTNSDSFVEYSNVTPATSIDLSSSQYFPPIGNQGTYKSCVSWATAYYQFTYEANKYNNIATTENNAYSPAFMFNMLNKGGNNGSNNLEAYRVLKNQGCLKMNESPYNINDFSYSWSDNVDALIAALTTRLLEDHTIMIDTSSNKITYNNDTQIRAIKQLLTSGKIINIRVQSNIGLSNWQFKPISSGSNSGDSAVVWARSGSDGHAMTIVGYDNNITCDINGDGNISESERGAFKVANSWGEDWGNDGYIWVMYDALNKESATNIVVNDRISVFDRQGNSTNRFYYIEVGYRPVNLVGLLNVNTLNRYGLTIKAGRNGSYSEVIPGTSSSLNAPFNGTIVFDYLELDDDIIETLTSQWYVRVTNATNSNMPGNISYKIVDNIYSPSDSIDTTTGKQLHLIKDFGTISTGINSNGNVVRNQNLNLQLGDLNYDSVISSDDATLIQNYCVSLIEFSDLQLQLADVNTDGGISLADAIFILQMKQ